MSGQIVTFQQLIWDSHIDSKSIQTVRLSIPITVRSLKWIGQGVLILQRDIRKIAYNLMNKVPGIDSLMVCILFGEIAIFHFRVMGLYSSNYRRFFVCRAVKWEPLGQFLNIVIRQIFWEISKDYQFQWQYEVWSELAKGFSIYSATYEKSPTIWWIKSHNCNFQPATLYLKFI
jgi:hypothetical protein